MHNSFFKLLDLHYFLSKMETFDLTIKYLGWLDNLLFFLIPAILFRRLYWNT